MKIDLAPVPGVICVCSPDEFEAVKAEGYPTVYVQQGSEYYEYRKLSHGRHILVKLASKPAILKDIGDADPRAPLVASLAGFFPEGAGKPSIKLFYEIVQFFREVTGRHGQQLEALAYIVWSQATGYYILVPEQRVGGASVNFNPADMLPQGHVIIVDLHSHNTMGAFFSATDNANDVTGIYYSGVIGKLTEENFEYIMRFNIMDKKIEKLTLKDVFKSDVPQAWMDNIKTGTAGYLPSTNVRHFPGTTHNTQNNSFPQGGRRRGGGNGGFDHQQKNQGSLGLDPDKLTPGRYADFIVTKQGDIVDFEGKVVPKDDPRRSLWFGSGVSGSPDEEGTEGSNQKNGSGKTTGKQRKNSKTGKEINSPLFNELENMSNMSGEDLLKNFSETHEEQQTLQEFFEHVAQLTHLDDLIADIIMTALAHMDGDTQLQWNARFDEGGLEALAQERTVSPMSSDGEIAYDAAAECKEIITALKGNNKVLASVIISCMTSLSPVGLAQIQAEEEESQVVNSETPSSVILPGNTGPTPIGMTKEAIDHKYRATLTIVQKELSLLASYNQKLANIVVECFNNMTVEGQREMSASYKMLFIVSVGSSVTHPGVGYQGIRNIISQNTHNDPLLLEIAEMALDKTTEVFQRDISHANLEDDESFSEQTFDTTIH